MSCTIQQWKAAKNHIIQGLDERRTEIDRLGTAVNRAIAGSKRAVVPSAGAKTGQKHPPQIHISPRVSP
jgi:hypothetical protein